MLQGELRSAHEELHKERAKSAGLHDELASMQGQLMEMHKEFDDTRKKVIRMLGCICWAL